MEFNENLEWDSKTYSEYINYLISMQDIEYKNFQKNLVQTNYEIIGIRVPVMRSIAKSICKTDIIKFLNNKESNYFEDIFIRGLIIASIKDKELLKKKIIEFSFFIDNWAINDSFSSSLKIIKKNKEEFFSLINQLISLKTTYSIRLALIMLLDYYVEDDYIDKIFDILDSIKSEEYYINMAKAWLLCDCFIKQKSKTLLYLNNNELDKFTINKAISKMRDSYRVSKEDKEMILQFKKS